MNKGWITLPLLLSVIFGLVSCFDPPENPQNDEVTQIDDYLASTLTSDLILYDNSTGIRFVFHTFGTEPPPHRLQTITANYSGRLFKNGTVFESGTITDKAIEDLTVPGLQYGIASLMKGSRITLYVPSRYGYGAAGTTNVPPNSILVYDIELLDVKKTAAETQQFTADTTAIHNYLKNKLITATQHSSGVWYTIENAGSGIKPTPYDEVSFEYKLKLLSDESLKEESSLTNQSVFSLIDGMKVALPLISKEGKATFYIPSGLAYGPTGTGSIPSNANLIFEVTLTDVFR